MIMIIRIYLRNVGPAVAALLQDVGSVAQSFREVGCIRDVGVDVKRDAVPQRPSRREQLALGEAGVGATHRVVGDRHVPGEGDHRRAGELRMHGGVLAQQTTEERHQVVDEVMLADALRPIEDADDVNLGARSQHRKNGGDVRLDLGWGQWRQHGVQRHVDQHQPPNVEHGSDEFRRHAFWISLSMSMELPSTKKKQNSE